MARTNPLDTLGMCIHMCWVSLHFPRKIFSGISAIFHEYATLNIVAEITMDSQKKCHATSGIIFPLFLQK